MSPLSPRPWPPPPRRPGLNRGKDQRVAFGSRRPTDPGQVREAVQPGQEAAQGDRRRQGGPTAPRCVVSASASPVATTASTPAMVTFMAPTSSPQAPGSAWVAQPFDTPTRPRSSPRTMLAHRLWKRSGWGPGLRLIHRSKPSVHRTGGFVARHPPLLVPNTRARRPRFYSSVTRPRVAGRYVRSSSVRAHVHRVDPPK